METTKNPVGRPRKSSTKTIGNRNSVGVSDDTFLALTNYQKYVLENLGLNLSMHQTIAFAVFEAMKSRTK